MKVIIAALLSVLFFKNLSAQKDSVFYPPKNAVYAEAGGNAVYYSVNYARFSNFHEHYLNFFRAGIGVMAYHGDGEVYLPLEYGWLIGKKRHYLELAPGLTFYSASDEGSNGHNPYIGSNTYRKTRIGLMGVISMGYCFLPAKANGLLFRADFTPIFAPGYDRYDWFISHFILAGGISIGYAF